jgi:hypothetical protein
VKPGQDEGGYADGLNEAGRVPRDSQGHADDAALRRRIGRLSRLGLKARDGRGVDDHPALVRGEGLVLRHLFGGLAGHGEGGVDIHVDDVCELGQGVSNPVGIHHPGGPAAAGSVRADVGDHGGAQRPEAGGRTLIESLDGA